MRATVKVEGLKELRAGLRALEMGVNREFGRELRRAADLAVSEAARTVPHRSGRLAASYRSQIQTSGDRVVGFVRSPLPYAGVVEYGGTIRPRGAPIEFRRGDYVTRAVERTGPQVVNAMSEVIDGYARRAGFH